MDEVVRGVHDCVGAKEDQRSSEKAEPPSPWWSWSLLVGPIYRACMQGLVARSATGKRAVCMNHNQGARIDRSIIIC